MTVRSEANRDRGIKGNVYVMVLTGLMAALTFAATSAFKIPTPWTQGYIHLGDSMVFLSVLILGRRNGTIAAGVGSALSDLLGGYAYWAPWTFAIKALMAFALGTIVKSNSTFPLAPGLDNEKVTSTKRGLRLIDYAGLVLGGVIMVIGYLLASRIMYGNWAAPLASAPWNVVQATSGIVISSIVAGIASHTNK